MKSWPEPSLPHLPGRGGPVRLHDTVAGEVVDVPVDGVAGLYVCGITPYDAAHLGHASTYVAFDLLHRAWLDAGHEVRYVQNVTDVDDPLLERATATGVGWADLAEQQTQVFRDDMASLAVVPPQAFVGVTEVVPAVGDLVLRLEAAGAAYRLDVADDGEGGTTADVYFDVASVDDLGAVSGLGREAMLHLAAERGGDPDRPGKRDALDPLLWRGRRAGEPSWAVEGLPDGRPGWHVECVAIALDELGAGFAVQGGGSDLVFPHHEMGAAHSHALGLRPYARHYVHTGMVALDGVKMSKSLGNLEFVHRLVGPGRARPRRPARAAGPPLPQRLVVDRGRGGRRGRPGRPLALRGVPRRRAGGPHHAGARPCRPGRRPRRPRRPGGRGRLVRPPGGRRGAGRARGARAGVPRRGRAARDPALTPG